MLVLLRVKLIPCKDLSKYQMTLFMKKGIGKNQVTMYNAVQVWKHKSFGT